MQISQPNTEVDTQYAFQTFEEAFEKAHAALPIQRKCRARRTDPNSMT
jgi:hypothetical protein